MEINIKLDRDFERFVNSMKEKYGEHMLELNGLSEKQLNHTEFIDYFVDKNKNTADTSIDGNANVGHKDVTTLENEMMKPHLKLLAYNKIFLELKQKYGLRQAKKWAEEEWNGAFYLHDFYSTSLKSYCFAYDLKPIVEKVASDLNIKLATVDIDENEELVKEFGIMSVPTLKIFKNGKEVNSSVGVISETRLKELLN